MWALAALSVAAVCWGGRGAAAAVVVAAGGASNEACGVAQFACRGGGCVPPDRYCDGTPECADGSDEPPHCTPCNRTLYGRAGQEYALRLGAAPRLPFLCHLTFTAGGGALGDLVQLGFDEFRVGRYSPAAADHCPDGYVQLAELGRPFTGGSWCGEAAGAARYYSETATVTLSLRLWGGAAARTLSLALRFRFLPARAAVTRYGPPSAPLSRGAVAPGTYCTRAYEECHRRPCRLQSPNYPGLYPRNVTCYWSLRQKDIPTCKHAMISIRQDHAHKIQIKRSISMASLNKTGRSVRAWRECTGERDRVIVYDGGSTDDAVLLQYCGGDWLPPVTSRGPEMLVAFHSSPYPAPPRALRGFELDVSVVFADSDSLEYAREPRRCEFHVKASEEDDAPPSDGGGGGGGGGAGGVGRRGLLHAPRHTLPPNTTCTWTFHGRPGDIVWIYFASYTQYSLVELRPTTPPEREELPGEVPEGAASAGGAGGGPPRIESARNEGSSDASPWARLRNLLRARPSPAAAAAAAGAPPPPRPGSCATLLRVWDGGGAGEPDSTLVGQYCDAPPALCARASLANATRAPRACAPPDGYVSRGSLMSLAVTTRPGTATQPLQFALHYEFVSARLPGKPLAGRRAWPPECSRVLTEPGMVSSPRNVLWFGRGGARRLRCLYRLELGLAREESRFEGEMQRVELTMTSLSFGAGERCATRLDPRSGRLTCVPLTDRDRDPAAAAADTLHHDHDHDDDDDEYTETDPDAEPPLLVPHLWIYESPWPGYRVPIACLCDNSSSGATFTGAGALEVELVARRLSAREDQRHVRWAGAWRRSLSAAAAACIPRRAPPPGGHLRLACAAPLLLEARANRSVFVRVWGEELPPPPTYTATAAGHQPPPPPSDAPLCPVTGRVLIHEPHTGRLLKAICPGSMEESARTVQLFTAEWWGGPGGPRGPRGPRPAALLVSWAGGAGAARVAWLEAWRGGAALAAAVRARVPDADNATLAGAAGRGAACPHSCPELEACADAALWCSGAMDCPRGADEAGCGAARLLAALGGWRAGAGAAAALGLGAVMLALLAVLRRRWRREMLEAKLPPPPRRLTQEPLLDSRPASAAS